MEHKLISGGEQYLPFARSRIKALRATGLRYATQKYSMPGGQVEVRIVGDHDYIRLSGSSGRIWISIMVVTRDAWEADSILLRFSSAADKAPHVYHVGHGTGTGSRYNLPSDPLDDGELVNVLNTPIPNFNGLMDIIRGFCPYDGNAVLQHKTTHFSSGAGDVDKLVTKTQLKYLGHVIDYSFVGTNLTPTGEFTSTAPIFFDKTTAEYSIGHWAIPFLSISADWDTATVSSTGFSAISPLTSLISEIPVSLPARTAEQPAYTRREVGWHKQGVDFIQQGQYVFDRRMNNAKLLDGGSRSSVAVSYDKFIRWKYDSGDMSKLQFCEQKESTARVISEIDLLGINSVFSITPIREALQTSMASGGFTSGLTPDSNLQNNTYSKEFASNTKRIEIRVMPDQADLFTRTWAGI